MCGIAGMVDWRAATSADALRSIADAMIETVRHRGPDAGDVWVEAEGGVALGQRRLAIIDLSPGGAQPMHSADRRFVITFNGEIYNYRDIRRELQAAGHSMRSDSDTEVLLEACALWGVEAAIERAIGMFAFALWDRKTRSLTLARDRLGIKPLYYAATPGAHSLRVAAQGVSSGSRIGNRRSMRMPSSVICATPTSRSRARFIVKPRSLPRVTS